MKGRLDCSNCWAPSRSSLARTPSCLHCSAVHWPAACTAPDEHRSLSANCVAAAAASRLKRK
eukprot:1864281-Pleurochrysis_carterae.AAC.1